MYEEVEVECEVVGNDVEDPVNDEADPMSSSRIPKVSQSVREYVLMDEPMHDAVDEARTYETNTSGANTSEGDTGVKGDTSVKGDTDVVTSPLTPILTS